MPRSISSLFSLPLERPPRPDTHMVTDSFYRYISKNFTLRLACRVRLRHWAHQAQIAILDALLCTHSIRTPTVRVRAPQTPPGANPPASSIFSQPLTFVDVLSCFFSSSKTLLILAPLRLLSTSSPPLIPFSLRIRPQSAPFPDAIHLPPYPFPFTL